MKDNVDIRTKDDGDILTLTCFSPQSTHSATKTISEHCVSAGSDASAQKSAIGSFCSGVTIVAR